MLLAKHSTRWWPNWAVAAVLVAGCRSESVTIVDSGTQADAELLDAPTVVPDARADAAATVTDASAEADAQDADAQDADAAPVSDAPAPADAESDVTDANGSDVRRRTGMECTDPPDPLCTDPDQLWCAVGSTACIFDFDSCPRNGDPLSVYALEGRHGGIYRYSPHFEGGANMPFNGSGMPIYWGLGLCAAHESGGGTPGDEALSDSDAIGVGFTLNDGAAWNACAYTGIEFTYGSTGPLDIRFFYQSDGSTSTYVDRTVPESHRYVTVRVPFPPGICSQLTVIEFRVVAIQATLAVRKLTLY